MAVGDMSTPLKHVRGLGPAKSGTGHFWRQRLTAVANVPLTIAFVLIVVALLGRNHAAVMQILGSPLIAVIMLLFIVSVTTHMRIGMQVIIEEDRKSTRLNSSHVAISYAVFCLKKKKKKQESTKNK